MVSGGRDAERAGVPAAAQSPREGGRVHVAAGEADRGNTRQRGRRALSVVRLCWFGLADIPPAERCPLAIPRHILPPSAGIALNSRQPDRTESGTGKGDSSDSGPCSYPCRHPGGTRYHSAGGSLP